MIRQAAPTSAEQRRLAITAVQRSKVRERMLAWCQRYALVEAGAPGRRRCVLSLLGSRCRSRCRPWAPCVGCLPSTLSDHGRFFRRPGEGRVLLFLGQPYSPLDRADEQLLARLRGLGLFARVGAYGEGWYHPAAIPIIISREPIVAHGYAYRGSLS